jgi:hypothetical protein
MKFPGESDFKELNWTIREKSRCNISQGTNAYS